MTQLAQGLPNEPMYYGVWFTFKATIPAHPSIDCLVIYQATGFKLDHLQYLRANSKKRVRNST